MGSNLIMVQSHHNLGMKSHIPVAPTLHCFPMKINVLDTELNASNNPRKSTSDEARSRRISAQMS
jgi:hypothetical protein